MALSDYRIVKKSAKGVSLKQVLEPARRAGETDKEAMDRLANGDPVVHVDDLPSREFRSSWGADDKGKVEINLDSVVNRILGGVRDHRNNKLASLDVPSMRALEDGDTKTSKEIKKKKDALRDLPLKVEAKLDKILNSKKKHATKLKELLKFRVPELED